MELVVRGAILLVAAHTCVWLLRRASAGTRSLVWNATFMALLALPCATMLVPSWRVHLPSSIVVLMPEESSAFSVIPAADVSAPTAPAPAEGPTADATALPRALSALWLGGVCILLAGLLTRQVRAALVVRRAEPLEDAAWDREANALAALSGVRAHLPLLRSDAISVPAVAGLVRPRLLLPRDAVDWSPARRRVVLLHELSHIRRGDLITMLVIDIATALHWTNPLAWLARSRAALAREQACDDAVLVAGIAPAEYARHLLALARRLTAPTPLAAAGAAVAGQTGRSGIERRIRSLLMSGRPRRPAGRLLRAVAPVALVAVLWPLAAVTFSGTVTGALQTALSDPSAEVRSTAAWAAGERDDDAAGSALVPLLRDPVADVRQQTAWALGELGVDAAVPHLVAALDDVDAEVRARAAWALGEMRAPAGRTTLTRLVTRDPSTEVRAQAAWALAELGDP